MGGNTISIEALLRSMVVMVGLSCTLLLAPASAASINANTIDRDGGRMTDLVIYATPIGVAVPPAGTQKTFTISQEDLQFSPYVTAIRTGTQIRFPNYDKIEHHVKSFSPAKEFEIKVYDKEVPPPVVFDKPGIVVVYCLFHGWMRAYVRVLDTPYFAITDTNGLAKLDKLPEGNYEINAWHPDMGMIKPPLLHTVKIGTSNLPLTFNFDFIAKKRREKN